MTSIILKNCGGKSSIAEMFRKYFPTETLKSVRSSSSTDSARLEDDNSLNRQWAAVTTSLGSLKSLKSLELQLSYVISTFLKESCHRKSKCLSCISLQPMEPQQHSWLSSHRQHKLLQFV